MQNRLSLVLSTTALLIAVFGATPLGHAASRAIHKVPPFAKTASYAKFAGNASKLNGRRSTLSGAPGTIPVVGQNGKLPASIGAVGPQGPQGSAGAKGAAGLKGDKGDTGSPGISGYEIVTASTASDSTDTKVIQASCPAGKKVVGGSGRWSGYGIQGINAGPLPDGTGWSVIAYEAISIAQSWLATAYAICVNVAE
jgi:hypothetical protein